MKKSTNELVTVYIPTHRRPEMALRAVKSVLNQDYPAIQIIVCDDGTPYADTEELRHFLKTHSAIYLRNDDAQGACFARNRAIHQAEGTLITGLDDDDEFSPQRVSQLVAAYRPSYAFVAASYMEISTHKRVERKFDHGYVTYDSMLNYNKIGNQVLTETSRMIEVGGFDTTLPAMQDYDLWLQLCKRFGRARKLPDCTYLLHTEHELGRISTQKDKLLSALAIFRKKYEADFKPHHIRSNRILEKKIKQEPLNIVNAIKALHPDNYRMVLSYYRSQPRK